MAQYPNRLDNRNASQTTAQVADRMAAFNMKERKDPKFIQFAVGDVLQGILIRIEQIDVTKDGQTKRVPRFVAEDLTSDNKEQVCFLGSYQLSSKLRPSDIGHVIEVRRLDDDRNAGRNGNAMQVYKVLVSDYTAPGWASDGTPITDDDIFS